MSYRNNYFNRNYSFIICQNCGEKGHHVKECSNPKTSLGIVLYCKKNEKLFYLMICRRNTIGFVEFMRGKYAYSDIEYLINLFNVMTDSEIEILKNNDFEYLWEHLWMDNKFNNKNGFRLKKNMETAREKFNKIRKGYTIDDVFVDIDYLCNKKSTFYKEQEWGFPKGRRSYNESDYNTAFREFNEETQISENSIRLVSHAKRFTEEYKSYDNVKYKNVYYLAEYTGLNEIAINENSKAQYSEVSNIEFFTLEDAKKKIREYNAPKKRILDEINEYLLT